jgi:hypothetical protein
MRGFCGRTSNKIVLGRPKSRWEDVFKMERKEVGLVDVYWINLAKDRNKWRAVVKTAMNIRVP